MFKLYEIVGVQNPRGYCHYGQILSMRTPQNTYMVRCVPGHSGTLQEMPEGWLKKAVGKVRRVHYANVYGHLSFPVDMLRYDHAAPVNFEITYDYPYYSDPDPKHGLLGLVIASASNLASRRVWTPDRWRSFGWAIEPINTIDIKETL